ncbi:hypothetical protein GXP70_18665 [Paenibacillus lycopersici]|uniref:GerMN domain-containing protein n=1 Tax=Paenibacillus lycopersici TaxID=2704462 RepID=A0A6C0FXI7_9BACL|nr:GerMN domain-containing protein [Paenibacillus lycopersici]QHT61798.1 hypothetical protein GXP70_18665 [Paenibacillus lycopersici]
MKRQSTKRLMLVLVAAAAIVSLSACGSKAQPLQSSESSNGQNGAVSNNGAGNDNAAVNEGSSDGTSDTGVADPDAVNAGGTGGQGTDAGTAAPEVKKQKEEISVYYTDDQMIDLHAQKAEIEYGDAIERLTAAFKALQKDSDKGEASLWKNVQLLSIKQNGDAVTLDVHLPDEARLGAPGEQLAIAAVTQTFFQFKDIASLDILVDGEAVSSLMGHEDLEHPIKKQS